MRSQSSPATSEPYPDLYPPFVWWSFGLTLVGGFGLAAHLSVVLGLGFSLGSSFTALVQAHGHLQLVGWVGLLLMGVSLYVFPRLTSSPPPRRWTARSVFAWALPGILLRVTAPVVQSYLPAETWPFCALVTCIGALCEAVAIALYLTIITQGVRARTVVRHELARLGPYFLPMLIGWAGFAVGNVLLSAEMFSNGNPVPAPEWVTFLNDLFTRAVLVSAILGFGVKMLPIFLGLRAPLWPVARVGLLYAIGTVTLLLTQALGLLLPKGSEALGVVGAVSTCVLSAALLWYVWELDALLFRVTPERISLKQFRGDAQLQRGRFGDRGEFGRFELFIVAGFAWLMLVALAEAGNALGVLLGWAPLLPPAVLRHMLLLGFVAHLICGVGHRLLPNLLHLQLRWPGATVLCFGVLTLAAVLRTAPLALAYYGMIVPPIYFALSGPLGLLALMIFCANLWLGPSRNSAIA